MDLNAFMTDKTPPKPEPKQETLAEQNPQTEPVSAADAFSELPDGRIPQGQRSTTLSRLAGIALIGHVYIEALIIAHGDGRNGKSTFWNVLSRVMGSYSGNISADALTVGCKRNVKPELAETKGKRLLIAAELEEGMRLNTSIVKQFCSTDEIFAEKKYKDPLRLHPHPHARSVYEPSAESGSQRSRYLAEADRRAVQRPDRGRRTTAPTYMTPWSCVPTGRRTRSSSCIASAPRR